MASPEFERLFGGAPTKATEGPSSLEDLRRSFDDVDGKRLPDGLVEKAAEGTSVPCRWLVPARCVDDRGTIVYVHGGGYVSGSARSHRHLGAYLAEAAAVPVLMVDYRLAPEHQFPAGRDDVVSVLQWLVDRGHAPASIAVAGDSAGAGLTMAALLELRARGEALPGALAFVSPWIDLTVSGPSMITNDALDPMIGRSGLLLFARAYLGSADPLDPRHAPLQADLARMPPCLIQVGERETLLDDANRLAERLRVAGCDVVLEPWPEMVHVWHALVPEVPEAQAAIERMAEWLAGHGIGTPVGAG